MPNPAKQIVLGAALLIGITMVTNADPLSRTDGKSVSSGATVRTGAPQLSANQVAALPPPEAAPPRSSIALPSISVVAPYSHPYTSGFGPKASPNGRVRAEHYQPPPDYDADLAKHPYSSAIGPPTEGARNRQGDLRDVAVTHSNR
jgi:hypothetical protein